MCQSLALPWLPDVEKTVESDLKACGREMVWRCEKEVKGFKKVICGFADLVCLRIVDERQVESVQGVQICLENRLQSLHRSGSCKFGILDDNF